MILVTVGTELPFDRLVKAVDRWAETRGRSDVFAQIGERAWKPKHFPFKVFLEPTEFSEHLRSASLIVAHAGMGTILSALHYGKPLLVMPRRAGLGEQRNDHQLATAERLLAMRKVNVAFDEHELMRSLDHVDELAAGARIGPVAGNELLTALRQFIDQ